MVNRTRLTSVPAVESRSGFLYCAFCDDFVYDAELERIRAQIRTACKGERDDVHFISLFDNEYR